MDDTLTVTLGAPVSDGSKEYTEITLREPTVGEMVKATTNVSGIQSTVLLVSLVSGVPRAAIERVPMRKFAECSSFLDRFLRDDQATGEA